MQTTTIGFGKGEFHMTFKSFKGIDYVFTRLQEIGDAQGMGVRWDNLLHKVVEMVLNDA